MKDVTKTGALVGIVLLLLIIIIFIIGNIKYGAQLLTRTTIVENDPTIKILSEQIENLNVLRKASLVNSDLSSDEIIKYVISNITEEEYTSKSIKLKKTVCEVTDKILFSVNENTKCQIMIINNDTFDEYQKRFFGVENKVSFDDFKYHGLNCKNDGTKYYCLVGDYENTVLDYSTFKSAYSEKDKIVIQDYYLRVNLEDKNRCLKYFDNDYCENYNTMDKPELDKEIIENDGVLYEYVFKDNGDNYYLEKSFIVSER